MDPDGFDSSVDYLGDPCTQMNPPDVNLITASGGIEGDAHSQKPLLFPANVRESRAAGPGRMTE